MSYRAGCSTALAWCGATEALESGAHRYKEVGQGACLKTAETSQFSDLDSKSVHARQGQVILTVGDFRNALGGHLERSASPGLTARDEDADEVVLDWIADEFDGEHVLKPITREGIEKTRQKALGVYEFLRDWDESFVLPEASAEDGRESRELIHKWAENRH